MSIDENIRAKLGRCEFAVEDVPPSHDGKTLSWSGFLLPDPESETPDSDLDAKRQQILGHVNNPDEPVIPFVCDAYPPLTGYYRVRSIDADIHHPDNRIVPFSFELEPVPGYQAPKIELWSRGAVRVNAHSITPSDATPWIGLPGSAFGIEGIPPDARNRIVDGETIDGSTVTVLYTDGGTATDPEWVFDRHTSFFLPAASFYEGAATIEVDGQVVVGEQIVNDPNDWRISNSLVRVTWIGSGVLRLSTFDGTVWRDKDFVIGSNSGSWGAWTSAPRSITVLRNSPECVAIRLLTSAPTASGGAPLTLDLSLRRGQRYVEGLIVGDTDTNWGVGRTDSETATGTGIDGGIMAASADANGNTYVMSSPLAHTEDLSGPPPHIYATADVRVFPFMVGLSTNTGASPDLAPFTPQGLIYQYMAAVGTRQNVGVR